MWNVTADALSRDTPIESEWSLDEQSFSFIIETVPDLQIDLFATKSNHRLRTYVAPHSDPQAAGVDAMNLDWNQWERIYLFPPVNLLMNVLHNSSPSKGGGPSGAQLARVLLVSVGVGTQDDSGPAPCASVISGSTEEDFLRFILGNREASAHDFLAFAMTKRLNVDRVKALFPEESQKVSTVRNYDATWKHFVAYVRTHRPDVISINFCIAHFRLLHDSGLAPATIDSKKSDLITPIWCGFHIDFKLDLFCNIPQSCAPLNPSAPPTPIWWSLSKVLDLAASIDNESCEVKKLSQGASFFWL